MRLSKEKIEELANEIMVYLIDKEMDEDVYIYCNNKRFHTKGKSVVYEEGYNPFDYFEYANSRHILSMSFEGIFAEYVDSCGYTVPELDRIFSKYGLYCEFGNSWNLSLYPDDDDMYENIDYTDYTDREKPEPIVVRNGAEQPEIPDKLRSIAKEWYELSRKTGDKGPCVVGAGFSFSYNGKSYFMTAQSPWQGCVSWEEHTGLIRGRLESAGASDIAYDDGKMD